MKLNMEINYVNTYTSHIKYSLVNYYQHGNDVKLCDHIQQIQHRHNSPKKDLQNYSSMQWENMLYKVTSEHLVKYYFINIRLQRSNVGYMITELQLCYLAINIGHRVFLIGPRAEFHQAVNVISQQTVALHNMKRGWNSIQTFLD